MKVTQHSVKTLWPSGIDSRLGRNRLGVRFLAVSDIYPMFIEPTITWVPSGFSGYIWLDTKIVLKTYHVTSNSKVNRYSHSIYYSIVVTLDPHYVDINTEIFPISRGHATGDMKGVTKNMVWPWIWMPTVTGAVFIILSLWSLTSIM